MADSEKMGEVERILRRDHGDAAVNAMLIPSPSTNESFFDADWDPEGARAPRDIAVNMWEYWIRDNCPECDSPEYERADDGAFHCHECGHDDAGARYGD